MKLLNSSVFISYAVLILLAAPAVAQTPVDLTAVTHELDGIQSAIGAGAGNGTLNPEAVQALEGMQKELTDRAAKLQSEGHVTSDETQALQQAVIQQEARLKSLSKTRTATRTVDPASLPPPVIEGPYGTVTTGGINQPVASPVITPTYNGPTTILPNGTVSTGTVAAPGAITSTVPATDVTPGTAR
jgi:hypothetical protein